MFYRLKRYLATEWFNLGVRGVRQTPPVVCDEASRLVLVSQLCHRDIDMYLLALKSLTRFVAPKRVCILDDSSLTEADKDELRRHVRPVEIRSISSVENGPCPKGKCWERLLLISETVGSDYVVQLDSDTLTLKRPAEVLRHLADNRSFTLAGDDGEEIVPGKEMAARMRPRVKGDHDHVQMVAEAALDRVNGGEPLRYVRGSAGFAGFGKESFSRKRVEEMSTVMGETIGHAKWSEWGSEQVASNLVVANTAGAAVLPFRDYCYHRPELDLEPRTFVHFMGTYRFRLGRYRRLGRRVVRELSGPA